MLLDVTSIAPATILLLDSFFYVVVFHGTTVAQWRKAEYHLNPEHAAFAALLEVRRDSRRTTVCQPLLPPAWRYLLKLSLKHLQHSPHSPVRPAVRSDLLPIQTRMSL